MYTHATLSGLKRATCLEPSFVLGIIRAKVRIVFRLTHPLDPKRLEVEFVCGMRPAIALLQIARVRTCGATVRGTYGTPEWGPRGKLRALGASYGP